MATPARERLASPLRSSVRKGFEAVGVYVSRFPPATLNNHLKHLFERLGINCVIDVGAHHGRFARKVRVLSYTGRIASFEPTSASYSILADTMKADPDWMGFQMGLSDRDTTAEIQLMRHSDLNSLQPISDYGRQTTQIRGLERLATESVVLRRLDSVFAEVTAGIASPRVFLKIDTQGHDAHVVAGAAASLPRVLALQSEIASRRLYQGVPPFGEALARYEALGYDPTGFFPVTMEADGLTVIEWDCVFTRADAGNPRP
jgi:FkbM family methyltransferase